MQGSLKSRVACSFYQFTVIARVMIIGTVLGRSSLLSSFSETQCPSESSTQLIISFFDFSTLCDCIYKQARGGRLNMFPKRGRGTERDVSRM